MYKNGDFVEGKGYFRFYLCKHCKKEPMYHKSDTKACPDSLRKSFPVFSAVNKYEPNEKKPVFTKFII